MEKTLIKTGRVKSVWIYKKKCPHCGERFATGKMSRVTCGLIECQKLRGLAYSRQPEIKARTAEYMQKPKVKAKVRKYMLNRYYALIMLKELERLAGVG